MLRFKVEENGIFFRLKPPVYRMADEPAGDAGGAATPASGAAAPSGSTPETQTGAPPESASTSAPSEADTLRAELKAEAQKYADKGKPKVDPADMQAPEARKPGETLLHDAVEKAVTPPPAAEQKPAGDETKPEGDETAEVPPTVEAPAMLKIGGEEYAPETAAEIIAYAKKADEYFKVEHPKFLEKVEAMKARDTELAGREAKLQEMADSPDMVLVECLAKYPGAKEGLVKFLEENHPEALGQFNAVKTEKTIETLQKEIQELKAQNEGRAKKETEQTSLVKQEKLRADTQAFVNDVVAFTQAKAKELGIDAEIMDAVESAAAQKLMARDPSILPKKGETQAQAVKNWIQARFDKIANGRKQAKEEATNIYLGDKQKLPPAPPTGGGAGRVSAPRAKTWKEAEERFQARLDVLKS